MPNVTITIAIIADTAETTVLSDILKLAATLNGNEQKPTPEVETAAAPEVETEAAPEVETAAAPTLAQFKSVIKKTKAEHGEEFVSNLLVAGYRVKKASTLGRTVSQVNPENYAAIMIDLANGPDQSFLNALDENLGDDGDGGGDDIFSDETPVAEVDPDAVKLALKAFAKSTGRTEAREIMTKYKCKALTDIDNVSQEDLATLLTLLT